jgi:hypothetical protein
LHGLPPEIGAQWINKLLDQFAYGPVQFTLGMPLTLAHVLKCLVIDSCLDSIPQNLSQHIWRNGFRLAGRASECVADARQLRDHAGCFAHHDDPFGLAGGSIEFEVCGAITNAVQEISTL